MNCIARMELGGIVDAGMFSIGLAWTLILVWYDTRTLVESPQLTGIFLGIDLHYWYQNWALGNRHDDNGTVSYMEEELWILISLFRMTVPFNSAGSLSLPHQLYLSRILCTYTYQECLTPGLCLTLRS